MPKKNVKWNDDWLKEEDENGDQVGLWARRRGGGDDLKAACTWCSADFCIRSGITNFKSHALSAKHRNASVTRKSSSSMEAYLVVDKERPNNKDDADASHGHLKDIVCAKTGEIRCIVRTILKNRSFESEEDIAGDLRAICPDSKVPPAMQLHRSKIAYMVTEALFPYMKEVVLEDARASPFFSLQIDEANKGTKYLAVVLRYLSPQQAQLDVNVNIVCIDLPALSSTTAEDMALAVMKTITDCALDKGRCVGVMTDSCNAMRGAKSGLVVRLQEQLPNIVDLGGCTLHHIHNAAKYACDAANLGVKVETLVRNIYCHFKFSLAERDHLHAIAKEFQEIKKLAFLRPVETRWLQLLPVVERVLRLLQPLVKYFAESKPHGANFASIRADLRDPKVQFFLHFLSEILKPLEQFELLFQQQGCQVHRLHPQLMELMRRWLLRFVKPAVLADNTKFWKVDVNDDSVWMSPLQISMGEPARRLFVDMSGEDQQLCLASVKSFFKTGTAKFMEYLPLGSPVLRACQLLDPKNQLNDNFVRWVITLAKHLPTAVLESEFDSLQVEARLHQQDLAHLPGVTTIETETVMGFWGKVATAGNRPLLLRIVQALLVLPHGNAEVERVFSNLNDVVTKKRSSLAPHTVKALVVARSCLQAMGWAAATLPMTLRLKNLCTSAFAAYRRRLEAEVAEAQRQKQQELETAILTELQVEKKASKVYGDLEKQLQEKANEIKAKQKQSDDSQRLLLELTRAKETRDRELEELRKEQEKLRQKKMKEAEKISEEVLKRKAVEQAISKSLPSDVLRKKFRLD